MVERAQTGGWMPSLYEPIRKAAQKVGEWFAPRADAAIAADRYEIAMELPGVDPANVEVVVQDGLLLVSGEKHSEIDAETKSYLFSEREFGVFQRAFRIPPDADASTIDAAFNQGVLRITLPKVKPAEANAKRITIRQG